MNTGDFEFKRKEFIFAGRHPQPWKTSWKILWKEAIRSTPVNSSETTHRRNDLTAFKRRTFLTITILSPVILFAILEILARLLNVGPDISLFQREEIGGRTYCFVNPRVSRRYFSRVEFHPATSPDFFLERKPPGTYRIFCLGGSTTAGFPYGFAGSFSTFVRERLKATFPDRPVEVVNLGMSATNSFTTADMLSELVNYDPDLVVIYDGHNEFYGALGVASQEYPSGWLTRFYLRMARFRVFILLRETIAALRSLFSSSEDQAVGGTMMERLARGKYIPIETQEYREALDVFRRNLSEIAATASARHIPVMMASQVSNLRNQPPFASVSHPDTSPERRLAYETAFNRGIGERLEGRIQNALVALREALAVDSSRADLYYEIARCLDTLGRPQEALAAYVHARDLDQLRFRTSSDFNDAIRQTCEENGLMYVDMEAAFRAASPDSIIGSSLMLDHLHPTLQGYFLMSNVLVQSMRDHGQMVPPAGWARVDTVTDQRLWNDRVVTPLDETCGKRRIEILKSGWPFHPSGTLPPPPASGDILAVVAEEIVQGKMNWEQGHATLAEHYRQHEELPLAAREYRMLMRQIPLNVTAYHVLADLYVTMGEYDEARSVLLKSLEVEETFLSHKMLGRIDARERNFGSAQRHLERALEMNKEIAEQTDVGYLLAVVHGSAGRHEEAVRQLRKILEMNPDHAAAKELLLQISKELQ